MLLERVVARVIPADTSAYRVVATLSCPRIREGQPGVCYTALQRNPEAGFPAVSFTAELRFNTRECDPSKNYEPIGDAVPESYPVNDGDVGPSDFVARVPVADFRAAWEAIGDDNSVQEAFGLSFKTVPEAVVRERGRKGGRRERLAQASRAHHVPLTRPPRPCFSLPPALQNAVFDTLGLAPCEGTGAVKAGTNKHQALLSGVFMGGIKVLARLRVTLEAETGVILNIAIRAEDKAVAELLMSVIA